MCTAQAVRWAQEWAQAENAYADRHGPQEELLTTEDLAGLNQMDSATLEGAASRLSTSSIDGLPGIQPVGALPCPGAAAL